MLLICCKESGASSQLLPSPVATERLGNSISEPSLTTRDALDKYQIVAQKVGNDLCCLSFLYLLPSVSFPPLFLVLRHYSILSATYVYVLDKYGADCGLLHGDHLLSGLVVPCLFFLLVPFSSVIVTSEIL